MQTSLADAVFAVLARGIGLRERVDAGAPLDWDAERAGLQAALAALAGPAGEAGDLDGELDLVFSEHGSPEERARLTRTTLQYALWCWLDEWLPPDWRPREDARLTADAGRFWDEARYAETRGDLDALEGMYLCVMLGFRGAWRNEPALLDAWVTRVRAKVAQDRPAWTMPASLAVPRLEPAPEDSPYRRLAYSALLTCALVGPLLAMLVWRL